MSDDRIIKPLDRVPFLDEARGFFLVLMIFYHGVYDLIAIFNVRAQWLYSPLLHNLLQPFIAIGFITIAGISSRYSRNNIKRGAIVFAVAIGLTLVTFFAMPSQVIWFGVLHLLGCCMMFFGILKPLHRIENRMWAVVGVLLCLLLFLLTKPVSQRYLGIIGIELPASLYESRFLFPLGFPRADFFSSDYFPLLPWFFLFMAGSFAGVFFTTRSVPDFFYRPHCKWLAWLGKKSMIIYVAHQPVTFGVLWIIFLIFERI